MQHGHEDHAARKRLPRLLGGGAGDDPAASGHVGAGSPQLSERLASPSRSGGESPSVRIVPASGPAHRKLEQKETLLKAHVETSSADSARIKKKLEVLSLSDVTDILSDDDARHSDRGERDGNDANGNSDDGDDGLSHLEQLRRWIDRVQRTFGTAFLLLVSAVYVSQGFNSFSMLAVKYFFKDHLKLQPAEAQALMTVMMFPWGIKPVYGIISDSLPFFKYHRKSYMIFFSALGTLGYLLLSIPDFITTTFGAVSVLTVNSLAASVIDVVIDARVVEMSRLDPRHGANDLQSVSWTAMAVGGVLGSFFSGPATDYLGARGVFFFAAAGPLTVLGFSLGMEEPKSRIMARNFLASAKRQFFQLKGAILTPVIWKCALWVFLSGAVSPGYSQVMFFFSTDVLKFSPEFLGVVSAFGFVFLLLGTLIYNAFFKDVSFRRIFLIAQISLAAVSLLEVILVTRANLKMGIPDKAFVLGDAVIADVVSRLKTMPVLVLCAKLCPKGVEGTLFALLMSISNFSFSVSEFWGAFICHALGIKKDAFDDLWIAIVIRSFMKLTPILFLFLIPASDPQEIVDKLNFGTGSDGNADEDLEAPRGEDEDSDDTNSPNGVIRQDHTVASSPDATPTPRHARRDVEVDV